MTSEARRSPTGCEPIREGARTITAEDISRFVPPEGSGARKGAVLMLFGEGPAGSRPAADRARPRHALPPGAGLLPRRLDRRHRRLPDRGGAARGRGGDRPRPGRGRGLRHPARAVAAAEQLRGHRRARLVARTPPRSTWSTPPRCTPCSGCRSRSCSTRQHRVTVVHPIGYSSPGFLIGDDQGPDPVGLHRRPDQQALRPRRAHPPLGRVRGAGIAGLHARPESRLTPSSGRPADLAKGPHEPPRLVPGRAGAGLRPLGLLAGLHHRRLRDGRPAARRPGRHLAGADPAR